MAAGHIPGIWVPPTTGVSVTEKHSAVADQQRSDHIVMICRHGSKYLTTDPPMRRVGC